MDVKKILYRDFLKNKRVYNLNAGYWRIKIQRALGEKILSEDQLIKNKSNDGKNFYDGNPIFSYYNSKNEKAIRIIQEDPEDLFTHTEVKLIEAWIDKITIPYSENDEEVFELVISVYLTRTSADKCMSLAVLWFNSNLNVYNIETQSNI